MFGLDVFDGKWWHMGDFSSLFDAQSEFAIICADNPSVTHGHVWYKGDCVWDSHPGEPEP